jgi:hypothetical protein
VETVREGGFLRLKKHLDKSCVWVVRLCGAGLQSCAGPPGPALADVDAGRRTPVLPHK